MGHKKKGKKTKIKKYTSKQGVEERLKKIASISPPDKTPYHLENERKIERFRPLKKKPRLSPKEKNRRKR